jgi:hypothetical protein
MKLNENLPKRFTRAIEKLYTAFHEGNLNAMYTCACAVGNICNNKSGWNMTDNFDEKNYNHNADHSKAEAFLKQENIGYGFVEIATIEKLFLTAMGYSLPFNSFIWKSVIQTKETQFKGLCAVVEYLCELDGIPNVMDFSKLFETEDNVAKYELIK